MPVHSIARTIRPVAAVALIAAGSFLVSAQEPSRSPDGFTFRTAVDLVALNATVTDRSGHVVTGLRAEDFIVYEDGERQTVSQFEAERVPVSLGLAVDTSGSMAGDKMSAARAAVSRFVVDLLGPRDQVFLYSFDSHPTLVQDWTDDRRAVVRSLGSVSPAGGTALYDAVAEAVPLAQTGTRRKKALVVISDGNDTDSDITVGELRQLIRESEVMVYAIGIDGSGAGSSSGAPATLPFPWPGGSGGPIQFPWPRRSPGPTSRRGPGQAGQERVNADALRMITDDSGGRTEIVYSARDLDPATAGIAGELSQQYFVGYVSTRPKDGRWHQIDVRVRNGSHVVRARKGYVAG
jgi:VWFA-related protein